MLGLIPGLPREGHLDVDVIRGHLPPRGDLGRLDLVPEGDLEKIEDIEVALDLRLQRVVGREPLEDGLVALVELADELLGRHAGTPVLRSSGSSWVSVSLVTTLVQRPWRGCVSRARAWVVKPNTGGRGATPSSLSVSSYPLRVSNGMIWIWFGAPQTAQETEPPQYPIAWVLNNRLVTSTITGFPFHSGIRTVAVMGRRDSSGSDMSASEILA